MRSFTSRLSLSARPDRDPPSCTSASPLRRVVRLPSLSLRVCRNRRATRARSFQFSTVLLAPRDAGIARPLRLLRLSAKTTIISDADALPLPRIVAKPAQRDGAGLAFRAVHCQLFSNLLASAGHELRCGTEVPPQMVD